jgi:hypothetical protein
MVKRFAAFLFVLTLAGNVWAGLCGCFDDASHPESNCCKRERAETSSVSKKPCCESECGQAGFVNVHRTQTDSSVKIPVPASLESIGPFVFDSVGFRRLVISRGDHQASDHRPHFPRPPNLYLKNSSLLI